MYLWGHHLSTIKVIAQAFLFRLAAPITPSLSLSVSGGSRIPGTGFNQGTVWSRDTRRKEHGNRIVSSSAGLPSPAAVSSVATRGHCWTLVISQCFGDRSTTGRLLNDGEWFSRSVVSDSCDPMDSSPSGSSVSSVHGIFQARILAWVAISVSRGSSGPKNGTSVSFKQANSCFANGFVTDWASREAQSGCPSKIAYLHCELTVDQYCMLSTCIILFKPHNISILKKNATE